MFPICGYIDFYLDLLQELIQEVIYPGFANVDVKVEDVPSCVVKVFVTTPDGKPSQLLIALFILKPNAQYVDTNMQIYLLHRYK